MFNNFIKKEVFVIIRIILPVTIFLILFISPYSQGQGLNPWATASFGFNGFGAFGMPSYSFGMPSTGSYSFGGNLFGQASMFSPTTQTSYYGSGPVFSSFGGSPVFNAFTGYSPFFTSTGSNNTGGYSYPTTPQSSFGQNIGIYPTYGFGNQSPSVTYQGAQFGFSPYTLTNSYQGNAASRFPSGNQGFYQSSPYTYTNNAYTGYSPNPFSGSTGGQNLWNWVPTSSGSTGTTSTATPSDSQLAELPPVSGGGNVTEYVPNQIVVMFKEGTTKQEQMSVHARHDCHEVSTSEYGGFVVVEIPSDKTVHEMIALYLQEDTVSSAEPNYIRHSHFIPNDKYFNYQWHHTLLRSTLAWDIGRGTGVKVALLDSGVAYRTTLTYTQASDLAGAVFGVGYDFVNDDASPDDDNGHGTHMAGCIAQTTNNFTGVAGVAFAATIIPIKVMDKDGSVSIINEIDGIYYATNNGADIINLSLGGTGTSTAEEAAINYAIQNGVVVICSAGNSGSSILEYPASYTSSISVSAVRYDKTLARYSNYGSEIDVCAPGGDITIDQNFDGYGDGILQQTHNGTNLNVFYYYFMEGTSPAAALVSGVAALILGKNGSLSPQQVKTILQNSATDLGALGWDQYYGSGLVNAYNALLYTPLG